MPVFGSNASEPESKICVFVKVFVFFNMIALPKYGIFVNVCARGRRASVVQLALA